MARPWRAVIDRFPAAEVRTRETLAADERLDGGVARIFLWTLIVFKLITVAVIFVIAEGSNEASILLSATTWPWLIIPGIALSGWLAFRFRLRRVRSRRLALQRSEWMIDERAKMDAGGRPIELDA